MGETSHKAHKATHKAPRGSASAGSSEGGAVRILLNGEPREVAERSTVGDLLERLGRHPRTVAVEYNGDILPRPRYGETRLSAGDRVEVVHFVQGG